MSDIKFSFDEFAPMPWHLDSWGSNTYVFDVNGMEVGAFGQSRSRPIAQQRVLARACTMLPAYVLATQWCAAPLGCLDIEKWTSEALRRGGLPIPATSLYVKDFPSLDGKPKQTPQEALLAAVDEVIDGKGVSAEGTHDFTFVMKAKLEALKAAREACK